MTSETNEIKITDMYKPDPRTFGGVISEFDFDERTYLQSAASKIFSDWKFDDTYTRIANCIARVYGSN